MTGVFMNGCEEILINKRVGWNALSLQSFALGLMGLGLLCWRHILDIRLEKVINLFLEFSVNACKIKWIPSSDQ